MSLNSEVRAFWEREPCGTSAVTVGDTPPLSREWFARIEADRYAREPFIHAIAQFTRHRGKRILEVGVGAGTDHLQFARAGAECFGVDLTEAAITTTREHLRLHGLRSQLQRMDAEQLPFAADCFDLVYSWGVIHHSEHPEQIIAEIRRVLRPGGEFIGMMYGRRSWLALKVWIRHALLAGRPWRSMRDVLWHHMESVGTKAYTVSELRRLFSAFQSFAAQPIVTCYDQARLPRWFIRLIPGEWGWFIALRALK